MRRELSRIAMSNHFTSLGLTPHFELDESELQAAYLRAQQESHPDRQVGKNDSDKQQAALRSAAANDAWGILKEPYLRAVHLLELQDIRIHGDNTNTKPEPTLLAEVMEWNEFADEVVASEAAMALGEYNAEHKQLMQQLSECFSAANYSDAAQITLKIGYLEKMLKTLENKVKLLQA